MHEVSLMHHILATAADQAARHGAIRILTVRLRLGGLSGVVPEALHSAFAVLRDSTPAAHATLECELVPPAAYCPACQLEFPVDDLIYTCPACGAFCPELRRGRELELTSLDIE